jgi:phosphotransferase system HPr-like phosphotransfer protein
MKSYEISIASVGELKQFYEYVNKFNCDFDLKQGKYCVDAKNIMGIMSLDITDTFELVIWMEDDKADEIMDEMLEKMDFL